MIRWNMNPGMISNPEEEYIEELEEELEEEIQKISSGVHRGFKFLKEDSRWVQDTDGGVIVTAELDGWKYDESYMEVQLKAEHNYYKHEFSAKISFTSDDYVELRSNNVTNMVNQIFHYGWIYTDLYGCLDKIRRHYIGRLELICSDYGNSKFERNGVSDGFAIDVPGVDGSIYVDVRIAKGRREIRVGCNTLLNVNGVCYDNLIFDSPETAITAVDKILNELFGKKYY